MRTELAGITFIASTSVFGNIATAGLLNNSWIYTRAMYTIVKCSVFGVQNTRINHTTRRPNKA